LIFLTELLGPTTSPLRRPMHLQQVTTALIMITSHYEFRYPRRHLYATIIVRIFFGRAAIGVGGQHLLLPPFAYAPGCKFIILSASNQGRQENINDIYQRYKIMIVSSQVSKLSDGAKILPKILTLYRCCATTSQTTDTDGRLMP